MHYIELHKVITDDHGLPRTVPVLVNVDANTLVYNDESGGYTHIGGVTVQETYEEVKAKIVAIPGAVS